MTSNAWKQVCKIWDRIHANDSDPNSYFTKHPYLVWYPIPFKDSPQAGIAINWNSDIVYDSEKKIDPYLVQNSFYAYGKGFPPNTKKQDEPLKFLNYTTQLQDYCFLSSRKSLKNAEKQYLFHVMITKYKMSNHNFFSKVPKEEQERLERTISVKAWEGL